MLEGDGQAFLLALQDDQGEVFSGKVLHGDEIAAFNASEIMDLNDVRMAQGK